MRRCSRPSTPATPCTGRGCSTSTPARGPSDSRRRAAAPHRSCSWSPTAGPPRSSPATPATSACPRVRVVRTTVAAHLAPDPAAGAAADLVFVDPPYDLDEPALRLVLDRLAAGWLAPGGLLVVERSTRSPEPPWPDTIDLAAKPQEVRRDHRLVRHPRLTRSGAGRQAVREVTRESTGERDAVDGGADAGWAWREHPRAPARGCGWTRRHPHPRSPAEARCPAEATNQLVGTGAAGQGTFSAIVGG